MDEYGELPDLKMSALAVLFQTKWNSKKANKSNDFVVKEAVAVFASSLEDDDIGYFYDPKAPNDLCTSPGELVGKIANSHLPYAFDFGKGIKQLVKILEAVDNDYNRVGLVISDCMTRGQAEDLVSALSTVDAQVYIIGIGKCAIVDGMVHVEDAVELDGILKTIRETLGIAT